MAALASVQKKSFDLDKNKEALQGKSVHDDIGYCYVGNELRLRIHISDELLVSSLAWVELSM